MYKIKQLEWSSSKSNPSARGHVPRVGYHLWEISKPSQLATGESLFQYEYQFIGYRNDLCGSLLGKRELSSLFLSIDEAKQACQSHFETLMKQGLEEV